MLLILCAIGAALIAAGLALAFGPAAGLVASGVLVIVWAVAYDLLSENEPEAAE